jgi:hypothetical protein
MRTFTYSGEEFIPLAEIARHSGRDRGTIRAVADKFGIKLQAIKGKAHDGRKIEQFCVPKKDVKGILEHVATLRKLNRRKNPDRRQQPLPLEGQHRAKPANGVPQIPGMPTEAITKAAQILRDAGVETFTFRNGEVNFAMPVTGSFKV